MVKHISSGPKRRGKGGVRKAPKSYKTKRKAGTGKKGKRKSGRRRISNLRKFR